MLLLDEPAVAQQIDAAKAAAGPDPMMAMMVVRPLSRRLALFLSHPLCETSPVSRTFRYDWPAKSLSAGRRPTTTLALILSFTQLQADIFHSYSACCYLACR